MSSPNGNDDAARLALAQCIVCKIEDECTPLVPGEPDYAMIAEVATVSNLINPIEETDPRNLVLCRDCGTMCKERAARSALNAACNRQQAPASAATNVPDGLPLQTESIKSSPASERNDSPLPPFATLFSPHRNVQYDLPEEPSADVEMLSGYAAVAQQLPAPEHQEQYGEPMEPLAGAETLLGCELAEQPLPNPPYQERQVAAMEHCAAAEVRAVAEPIAAAATELSASGEPDEPPYPTASTPAYTFADFPRAEERAAKRRAEQAQAEAQLQLQQEQLLKRIKKQQQHPQPSGRLLAETAVDPEAGPSGLASAGRTQQANLPTVQSASVDYAIRQRQHEQQQKQQVNQLIDELLQQALLRRRQQREQPQEQPQQSHQPQQRPQQHQPPRSDPAGGTADGAGSLASAGSSQNVLLTIGALEQGRDPGVRSTPVDYSIGQQEELQQRFHQNFNRQVVQQVRDLLIEQRQLAQQQEQQQHQSGPDSAAGTDAGERSLASAGSSHGGIPVAGALEQQHRPSIRCAQVIFSTLQQGEQQQQQQQQQQQHQLQQQQQQLSGNLSAAPGHQETEARSMNSAGPSQGGVSSAGAPEQEHLPANQSAPIDYTIRQEQQPSSSGSNITSTNNRHCTAPQLYMHPRGQLLIPQRCERCNKELADFYEFRRHLYESHDLLQCIFCKLYFNVYVYEQHMHQCFGRSTYCLTCKAWYPMMTYLTDHTHDNSVKVGNTRPKANPRNAKKQCRVCGRHYARTYVAKHIRTQHPSAE